MKESLWYVSFRSLLVTLFSMIGVALGLILFIILFGGAFFNIETEPEYKYAVKIAPNAEGVRKSMPDTTPVILKLDIAGTIGTDTLTMDSVKQMLIESREDTLKDNRVKGLMLYIQSPGGAAVDSDSIYHAIKAYKEQYKVPVYAYVDGLCASGGMYVACAADKIYASEVSLVGSVGVIIQPFVNLSTLMDKVGVNSMTLYAGKGKDDMNPLRQWKPGEQDNLQSIVDDYYAQFVNIVAENRPRLDKNKLIKEYGANIFPAAKAFEYGYIDAHGVSYSEVLKTLVQEIGIQDDNYQVLQMESKNWVSQLLKSSSPVLTGTLKHQIQLPPELNPALMNKFLYLYQPGL